MLHSSATVAFPPCDYSGEAGTDSESMAMRAPKKQVELASSVRRKKSALADAAG